MADFPTSVVPRYVWEEEREFKTIVFEAENGSEQFDQAWASGRHIFHLVYDLQDASTIWDFFVARKGRAESFSFDPNDFMSDEYASETLTMRFASDKQGRRYVAPGYYGIEFTIREDK